MHYPLSDLISNGYDNKDIVLSCCTFLSGCYLTITVYTGTCYVMIIYMERRFVQNEHGNA